MIKYKLLMLLMSLFVICCQKNSETVRLPVQYKNIEKHIQELASDKYQGRGPMSEAEPLVLSYISGQMKDIGIEPANNGSYFQDVPILAVTSKISESLVFESESEKLEMEKLTEYVAFSRKVEDEMLLESSEVVFAGFGITAPEYGRNDYEGIDVAGKTVIVFVNDPGYDTSDSYFKGNTMTYYGRWTYKFEEAARQGAKACFIVHETGPAGYPWGVVKNNGESTELYLDDPEGYKDRCSFEGWISHESAIKLFETCGYSFEKMKELALAKDFIPFKLPVKASAKIKSKFERGISKNICGFIKGKSRPEEVIVYTAHWDHLGIGKPVGNDSIYNGATDNAAAVSWILEIARPFTEEERPDRSILFLSVTCEESGLLGAKYYVQNPFFPMNKTVACINTDVILFLGKFKDITLTGYGHSELDEWVEREAVKQGRYVAPDPNPENGMFFRSDQFPFVKQGVPAIFAKGYIDSEKLGNEKTLQAVSDYWKNIYHTPQDEYLPERDNLAGLVDDANLLFNVGLQLANSDQWPEWHDNSEFKAVRENSFDE